MDKKHIFFLVALTSLDQFSKFMIQLCIDYKHVVPIIPEFLNLTNLYNTSSSFSFLGDHMVFYLIATTLVILLLYKFYRVSAKKDTCMLYGILCLMAGGLGNLMDRILFHYVRDFILISIPGIDFPIFNIADVAIVLGFLLVLYSVFQDAFLQGKKTE